jgi:hypothetical protein
MKAFIEDPMTGNVEAASSCLAQLVKAATFFERASHMGGNQMSMRICFLVLFVFLG